MSTSLLALVPVALLFIVSGLCFVGCILNTEGYGVGDEKPKPFTTYTNDDILANPDCIAYWPLNDSTMQTTAIDAAGKAKGDPHNGEYKSKDTHPTLFPCPAFTVDPAGPLDSAFAPGDLTIGAPGIVPGDTNSPFNDPNAPTSAMNANGGFVTVPANSVVNPGTFTVECWVRPEWDVTASPAYRTIIDSRNQGGGLFFGFVIFVNQGGEWEAQLGGTGAGNFAIVPGGSAALSAASHVVLTCDGTKAALFINGAEAGSASLPGGSSFAPNTAAPLVIGVGAPYLPERTQPSDNNFFPLLPFNGTIQCVAIYNVVLDASVIETHFNHGSGKPDPAG